MYKETKAKHYFNFVKRKYSISCFKKCIFLQCSLYNYKNAKC